MHKYVLKSSKKLFGLKRLSDFYFQVTSKKNPETRVVISDTKNLFVSPLNFSFCECCFQGRYEAFLDYEKVSLGEMCSPLSGEIDVNFEESLLDNLPETKWTLIDLNDNERYDFDLISYESCLSCNPRNEIDFISYDEGENLLDKFYANRDVNSDLEEFLLEDSFGFISFFNTFDKAGFGNEDLEKILDDNYVSTLLAKLPGDRVVMSGAQDKSEKLSRLKAIMEFVERYALINRTHKSSIMKVDNQYDATNYLSLFKPSVVDEENKKTLASTLIWGVNLIKKEKTLIPVNAIYSIDNVGIKNTSNGFAAHTSLNKAIENATFELIERDAFMRFWFDPKVAATLKLETSHQSSLNTLVNVLESITGNAKLEARVVLLPSITDVPVVAALITSRDCEMPPAIIAGYGSGFKLNDAINKAICELRVNILNFAARYQKEPNWMDQDVSLDVRRPEDHMNFYAHPSTRPKLKFLDYLLSLKQIDYNDVAPKSLDKLYSKLESLGIDLSAIDVTPKVFEDKGVFVIKVFSSKLYPLQFGYPSQLGLEPTELSVAEELPHFFT